jgi:hypothetical protein
MPSREGIVVRAIDLFTAFGQVTFQVPRLNEMELSESFSGSENAPSFRRLSKSAIEIIATRGRSSRESSRPPAEGEPFALTTPLSISQGRHGMQQARLTNRPPFRNLR